MAKLSKSRNGKLNRKQRKELTRQLCSDDPGLEIVHQHVAGIDIGNKRQYVAVPPACDAEPVREFGSGTADLVRMAEWLKSGGIRHVVMQSTGVLEQAGFEICLNHARDTNKPDGAEDGCAGESMADEAAHI